MPKTPKLKGDCASLKAPVVAQLEPARTTRLGTSYSVFRALDFQMSSILDAVSHPLAPVAEELSSLDAVTSSLLPVNASPLTTSLPPDSLATPAISSDALDSKPARALQPPPATQESARDPCIFTHAQVGNAKRREKSRAAPVGFLPITSRRSTAKLGFVPSAVSAERSESEGLEQEVWRRLVKIEPMLASTLPFTDHLANTLAIWNHQPLSPTFMDLSTPALLTRPFSASYASQLWSNTQAMVKKSTPSHRALYSLRLDFSQAVEMFEQVVGSGLALSEDEEFDKTPIEMVTDVLLLETIKALLGKTFIKTIETHPPSTDFDHISLSVSTLQLALDGLCPDDPEMCELAKHISVIGKESQGRVGTVLKLWEKLRKEQSDDKIYVELENDEFKESDDGSADGQCQLIKEIRELIKALVLLRKVLLSSSHMTSDSSSTSTYSPCHSSTMTPTASTICLTLSATHPSSPSPTLACFSQLSSVASSALKLPQALAASVFDEDKEIDEARDTVVDMLCSDRLRRPRFH